MKMMKNNKKASVYRYLSVFSLLLLVLVGIAAISNVSADDLTPYCSVEFEGLYTTTVNNNGSFTMIGPNTAMWINATNPQGYSNLTGITYEVWNNPNQPSGYMKLYDETVYDNQTDDWNLQTGEINVKIYFEEECFHEVRWDLIFEEEDSIRLDYDFAVDLTAPDITKFVGMPEVDACGQYDSWVNCATPFTFNATDDGCNGGSGVSYIIYKVWQKQMPDGNWIIVDEGTIYDDSQDDLWDMAKGEIQHIVTMNEECMHEIEFTAFDYVGNNVSYKQKHLVDCSPPDIDVDVGDPNCTCICRDCNFMTYCVKPETPITITVEDRGCIPDDPCHPDEGVGVTEFSYRVWNESHGWSNWTLIKYPDLTLIYYFQEECKHYLEIQAADLLGNHRLVNWTFFVDEQPPQITIGVGNPNVTGLLSMPDFWVTTDTLITLNAEDMGCCPCPDTQMMYRIGNETDVWSDWMYYDVPFTFQEECVHKLQVKAWDCLNNTAQEEMIFYVDVHHPEMTLVPGDPFCFCGCIDCVQITHDRVLPPVICVNTSTPMIMNMWDEGCQGGVGLCCDAYNYRIWSEELGWGEWINVACIVNYTFFFEEECMHYVEVNGSDFLGNFYQWNYTFFVDESPPAIDIHVGDPNCTGMCLEMDEYIVNLQTYIGVSVWEVGCCPCPVEGSQYRIWWNGSWSYWTNFTCGVDIYFMEECHHILEVRAWDCLGNIAYANKTFYVDMMPPEILVDVGDPECVGPCLMIDEFMVSTQTNITISASDITCAPCNSLNISYRIWWNGSWSDWTNISSGFVFKFSEECKHYLEVMAWDCLGNMDYVNYTFFVDDSPPEINVRVGDPYCVGGCLMKNEFIVTLQTSIDISARDVTCSPCYEVDIEYRIWWNGSWSNWTIFEMPFTFSEECKHYLEVRAWDCLGNMAKKNLTFYVTADLPELTFNVGEPKCDGPCLNETEFMVTSQTPISLDVIQQGCYPCDIPIEYRVWYLGDWSRWMPYNGSFNLSGECIHYVEARAYDCFKNQLFLNLTFYVDESAPVLEKIVHEPSWYLGVDNETGTDNWLVYPETLIEFNAQDMGCSPCATTTIWYRVWYLGVWTEWIEYVGPFSLSGGCLHYLEAKAVDCLGNEGCIDNETFWVCDSGGSSVPTIEILSPEDGTSFNGRTIEIDVEASDQETSWDDLIVKVGIPGGRRNAPDMWFDAVHVGGGRFAVDVDIFMYQNGAQLTFDALALDEDGNVAWAVPVTITVETTIIWDQWMQQGWNSLTLPPDASCNTTVERVMSSIEGSYDFVFHHIPLDGWISYYINDEYNSLSSMESGKEYWVHVSAPEGAHYYIGGPQIEILSSQHGVEFETANVSDFYGTTWSSDGGVESVDLVIVNMVSQSEFLFWNGSDWTDVMSMVPAELESSCCAYHQEWSFNASTVDWMPGDFMVSAVATDVYGCTSSDEVSFSIFYSVVVPEFTNVVLLQDGYFGWEEAGGDFENGFIVWLDEYFEGDFYHLNLSNPETTTNVPLMEGMYPFYLSVFPSNYTEYWDIQGVNASAAPGSWQAKMFEIISGISPMFYINVSASQEFMLIDGLQYQYMGLTELLRVSSDYLTGDYTFTGHVMSDMGVLSNLVEVDIIFDREIPS